MPDESAAESRLRIALERAEARVAEAVRANHEREVREIRELFARAQGCLSRHNTRHAHR